MSSNNKIEVPLIKTTNENLKGCGYMVDKILYEQF
jgi:hypothetical protein